MFLGTEVLGGLIYVILRDSAKFIFNLKDKGEKENKEKVKDKELQERFDKLENRVLDLNILDKKVGE